MADKQRMTDKEITSILLGDLQDGVAFSDDTLSKERDTALKYYYGELPQRLHRGSSGYRSLDVHDQVETARAMLLETFLGNELPLKLVPGKSKVANAVQVSMATEYVNDVVFTQNHGEEILDQVIFDSLMSRIGVVRVDWEDETKVETRVFPPAPMDVIDKVAAQDDVVEVEVEESEEQPGMWVATVTREVTEGRVKISPVRPEDFIVRTSAKDAYEYPIAHRLTKRMSVWISEGFKESDLKQALTEEDLQLYELAQTRNDAGHDDGGSSIGEEDPLVTLLDAYSMLDLERNGTPRYYRVLMGGNKIFGEPELVDDHPFVHYVPIKIPHVFHGVQFTKTIVPTANAKTALTRSVIDHAMRTNNPRWTVLRGTFDNPRELLENKFGGIVNINKPDGVQPLPQAGLNPFVFETLKLLDTDLSDTTGISRMTQGLDKDVISKQNSQGMVNDMARAAETRLRVMARRFASGFLKELARKVYATAVANDSSTSECVVDGKPTPVTPAEWPAEATIQVRLELSAAQKEKRVAEIANMVAMLSQDEALGQQLDYKYKRRLAVEAMKLQGMPDAEAAINPEPPQPDPMAKKAQELELQAKQVEIQVQQTNAEAGKMKAETERMKALGQLNEQERGFMLEQWKAQAEFSLEERKQAFNEAAAAYEKGVIDKKMDKDPESVKAIAAVDS
jgi:hypothetical protein